MPSKNKTNATRKTIKRSSTHSRRRVETGLFTRIKQKSFNPIFFILGFIVVGFILVRVFAALTPTPTPAQVNCGKRVATYNYQRVGDPSMPWNVPVCAPGMTKFSQSDDYRDRLWYYGMAPDTSSRYMKDTIGQRYGQFDTSFGLNPGNDYSTPIYRASDKTNGATTTTQIQVCGGAWCIPSNLDTTNWSEQVYGGKGYLPSTAIPWNPNWRGAAGKDREMLIIDDRQEPHKVYGLWGASFDFDAIANCGILFRERLCAYGADVFRDSDGKIADYRTSKALAGDRGLGLTGLPMTITPEEVEQGEIRQALYMEAFNTMTGPACTDAQLSSGNYGVLGKTCGYAIAPAQTHEWKNATDVARTNPGIAPNCPDTTADRFKDVDTGQTIAQRVGLAQQIPSGMRFALDMTDNEIDAWLATKTDYSARKKQTARIFAIALRDYGWIVGDTTCWGAHFPLAGSANPVTKQKWANLGIADESSQKLLNGLFKREKIYVVSPSTNQCIDGKTSQFACDSKTSNYPAVSLTQTATAAPTVIATVSATATPTVKPTSAPTTTVTPTPTTPTPSTATNTSGAVTNVIPTNVSVSGALLQNWGVWPPRYDLQIKWSASTVSSGVKEYVILRDGKEISRQKTTSYTDVMDLQYQHIYSVQAIGVNGNKSTPALYTAKPWCLFIICGLGS